MARARIPLSAFRVPEGKIALTLKLHGIKCTTAVIAVIDLDDWLDRLEVGTGIDASDRGDLGTHVQLRKLLRQHLASGDDAVLDACVAAGLWLALNHPLGADTVRTQVAASIRSRGRAQVTVTSDRNGLWGFAVSERPAELETLMASVPAVAAVCVTFPERSPAPPSH